MIEDKFTKYYINVYTRYRIFTTSSGSRIKAKKKNIKIKKKSLLWMTTSASENFYCGCRHPQCNVSA